MSCLHMFLLKQESHRLRNIKIIKGTAESCIYLNDLNDKHFNKGKNMKKHVNEKDEKGTSE